MPWTPKDGPERHTKAADTGPKRRQWSDIANKILKATGNEGQAVREANAAVRNHPAKGKSDGRDASRHRDR